MKSLCHLVVDLWEVAVGEPKLAQPEDCLQIMLLTC